MSKITMSDDEQTALCNRLRNHLMSIASMAVEAQQHIGADKCSDLLYDIERDCDLAQKLQDKLTRAY